MADEITIPEQVRKTISMTHKQAGLSAGGIAALTAVLVGPLSQIFQTKLDAQKQDNMIQVQASQIIDIKNTIEKNTGIIVEKLNDVVKPVAKNIDNHETRIVNLEFIQMKKGGK